MRVGLHVRVAGGYAKADRARQSRRLYGVTSVLVESAQLSAGRDRRTVARGICAAMRREAGIDPCAIHTPYLINLASEDPKIATGSLRLLRNDLAVAARGGMRLVNTHLGSYGHRDRKAGFSDVCRALEAALTDVAPGVFLVLENSAGAGNLAGGTLEELGSFVHSGRPSPARRLSRHGARVGVGLRNRFESGGRSIHRRAAERIGLDRVMMFHFNDTEVPLGASRDRHWHIGEGKIGIRRLPGVARASRTAREDGDSRNARRRCGRRPQRADDSFARTCRRVVVARADTT